MLRPSQFALHQMFMSRFCGVFFRRRRFIGLVSVLLSLGCSSESTVADQSDTSSKGDQQPQIILRFKPGFPPLTKSACVAAYLGIAGAQKGFLIIAVRPLFSGAHVVSLRPTQRDSDTPAFTQYLSQQLPVDYAELDSVMQTKPAAAARAKHPSVAPGPAPLQDLKRAVSRAQLNFRAACGSDLAEPD